jgi:hypothetical protein
VEVHECCLWRIANFLSILKFAMHTLLTTQEKFAFTVFERTFKEFGCPR